MNPRANFEVISHVPHDLHAPGDTLSLWIRDIGPWDRFPTITNSVEEVLSYLLKQSLLHEGQRVFYQDSEGHYNEIEWSFDVNGELQCRSKPYRWDG